MTRITGMTFKRKTAVNRIGDLNIPIVNHLLLLLVFGKNVNTNHWLNEIVVSLLHVYFDTFVKGGKRLKPNDLSEYLIPGFIEHEQVLDEYIKDLISSKPQLLPITTQDKISSEKLLKLYLKIIKSLLERTTKPEKLRQSLTMNIKEIFGIELE